MVKNKSVFTSEELKSFYKKNQFRTIIKPLFLRPFDKKVTLSKLEEFGIVDLNSGPRISTTISPTQAEQILKGGEQK